MILTVLNKKRSSMSSIFLFFEMLFHFPQPFSRRYPNAVFTAFWLLRRPVRSCASFLPESVADKRPAFVVAALIAISTMPGIRDARSVSPFCCARTALSALLRSSPKTKFLELNSIRARKNWNVDENLMKKHDFGSFGIFFSSTIFLFYL